MKINNHTATQLSGCRAYFSTNKKCYAFRLLKVTASTCISHHIVNFSDKMSAADSCRLFLILTLQTKGRTACRVTPRCFTLESFFSSLSPSQHLPKADTKEPKIILCSVYLTKQDRSRTCSDSQPGLGLLGKREREHLNEQGHKCMYV